MSQQTNTDAVDAPAPTIDEENTDPQNAAPQNAAADGDDITVQVAQLAADLAEARDDALRARADYQNLKRRTEEEKITLRQFLVEDVLNRLLPIVDNFDRALAAARSTQDTTKLVDGIVGIHRQMIELLEREGVTTIDAVGETFDPNIHNAVLRDESGDYPDNTVVEELQRGYRLGDRVLRPTLVKVAAGG